MWFRYQSEIETREQLIKLLKAYDCRADFTKMTNIDLKDHLYDHQFDSHMGEWPEDP